MIKWIWGMGIIFVAAGLFGSLLSGDTFTGAMEQGQFSILMSGWQYVSSGNILQMAVGVVLLPVGVVQSLGAILFWDAEFWEGPWLIIKLFIFMPLSIGIITSFVLQLRGGGG